VRGAVRGSVHESKIKVAPYLHVPPAAFEVEGTGDTGHVSVHLGLQGCALHGGILGIPVLGHEVEARVA
jgi:hypothetical protein